MDPDALDCGGDCAGCMRDTEGQAGVEAGTAFTDRVGSGVIVRTAHDRDQYMVWSSIAGRPTFVGSRADLLNLAGQFERDVLAERLDRAAATGTSFTNGDGGWDSHGFLYQTQGWILRCDFPALADAFAAGRGDVSDLITAFDQEDPHA